VGICNFVYSLNDCICFWVVTCSWFVFNVIIVTHLFELMFEFAYIPIVKDNKLRSLVTCQPGVMNQYWMDVADLFVASTISDVFVASTISNQLVVAGSMIVSASRECVLAGVFIVNGLTRSRQTMTQGLCVRFCYFGKEQPIFLTLLLCHLTHLISET
jgi:hypothetical protein